MKDIDIQEILDFVLLSQDLTKLRTNNPENISDLLISRLFIDIESYDLELEFDEIISEINDSLHKLRENYTKEQLLEKCRIEMNFNRQISMISSVIKNYNSIKDEYDFKDNDTNEIITKFLRIFSYRIFNESTNDIVPLLERGVYSKDITEAIHFWETNKNSDKSTNESAWQEHLSLNKIVLERLLGGDIIFYDTLRNVGNSNLQGKGNKIVDFFAKNNTTNNIIIVEIKTPKTKLLGNIYRNTYPLSKELSGTVSQVTIQKNELVKNYYQKLATSEIDFEVDSPKCIIISGNIEEEINDKIKKSAFEIQRQLLKPSVEIYGFDEIYKMLSHFNYIDDSAR